MIQPNTHAFTEKWGEAAKAGFLMVPDLLLKHQGTLGLTPTELIVLLNICMHWWYAERLPRPRTPSIASRMRVQPRTVQRALKQLQKRKFITKVPGGRTVDGPSADDGAAWDLSGLVTRLEKLAKTDPAYLHRTGH